MSDDTQHGTGGSGKGYRTERWQPYEHNKTPDDPDSGNSIPHPEVARFVLESGKPVVAPKGHSNNAEFLPRCAVVIGAFAVILESTLHPLATIYADPLPHHGYLLAYVLAILAPLWVSRVLKNASAPPLHVAFAVAGNVLSLLIAGMMSLALLPVSPFAVVLSFFGFGLLGLSPYFVFALSLYQMRRLQARIHETGVSIGRAAVFGAAATVLATGLALFVHPVVSGALLAPSLKEGLSPAEEHAAAARLHSVGGDNALLILCYRTRLPLWESAGALLSGGDTRRCEAE
jgi:hypothetical protein